MATSGVGCCMLWTISLFCSRYNQYTSNLQHIKCTLACTAHAWLTSWVLWEFPLSVLLWPWELCSMFGCLCRGYNSGGSLSWKCTGWCDMCYNFSFILVLLLIMLTTSSYPLRHLLSKWVISQLSWKTILTNTFSLPFYHLLSDYIKNLIFLYKYWSDSCTFSSLFLPISCNK